MTDQSSLNKNFIPFKVAFTAHGDLCEHNYACMEGSPSFIFMDNCIFEDELEYMGYAESEKENRILFKSLCSNRILSMFMSDFDSTIKANLFLNNKIKGTFSFCKKNGAQGVRLYIGQS